MIFYRYLKIILLNKTLPKTTLEKQQELTGQKTEGRNSLARFVSTVIIVFARDQLLNINSMASDKSYGTEWAACLR